MEELKKTHWKEAAREGAVIGGVISAIYALSYLLHLANRNSWIEGTLIFMTMVTFVLISGHKRAAKYGSAGFTYGQSLGYIASMMLFTGFIAGLCNYILRAWVDPPYYMEQIERSMAAFESAAPEQYDMALKMAGAMQKNPVVMVLGGMINMLIYGTFVGLFLSVFIKKDGDPFADVE